MSSFHHAVLGLGLAVGVSLAAVPAQAAGSAHITGTVTGSGGPLAGVTVSALQASDSGWSEIGNATTDTDGSYDLSGLEAGDYTLGFYDGPGESAGEYWKDVTSLSAATTFPVADGAVVDEKNADLAPGRHITGTVRGAGDAPLEHVEVSAYPSQAVGGEQVVVEFDETDAQGRYDISRLPQGTYRIGFRDNSGVYATEYYNDRPTLATAEDIVVSGGDAVGRDAVLATVAAPVTPPTTPPAAQKVVPTKAPAVTGRSLVGRKLVVKGGAWSPAAVTVTYQWLANGKPIKGATSATLKLKKGQVGKKISVQVTATASGYTASTVTTAASKKVKSRAKR